jgi:hypothetical protein
VKLKHYVGLKMCLLSVEFCLHTMWLCSVVVFFKAIGDAPILKQSKFKVGKNVSFFVFISPEIWPRFSHISNFILFPSMTWILVFIDWWCWEICKSDRVFTQTSTSWDFGEWKFVTHSITHNPCFQCYPYGKLWWYCFYMLQNEHWTLAILTREGF